MATTRDAAPMRLLDRVARCRVPLSLPARHGATSVEVAGPGRFAAQMAACPLRFVLGDDLTRASAELGFGTGPSEHAPPWLQNSTVLVPSGTLRAGALQSSCIASGRTLATLVTPNRRKTMTRPE